MTTNPIGEVLLNQFRVDAFIAAGGMGTVYRVWDLKRNVHLAMKVLHADLAEDPSIFKRFKREANALKKLAHPNIVPFYGLYQSDDLDFLLERFIDGPTLKEILRQNKGKPFFVEETLIYMKSLTAALGYAHAHGVVHCDVKPGNVMVDRGGSIYLTDFGIARHAESTTTTLATAGTAAYMAPEQIRGELVTPATDVYSLGLMLFEMLTGRRAFRGDEAGTIGDESSIGERIRAAQLNLPPPNPSRLNANLPPGLVQVILTCLEKSPNERYSSMQELFVQACAAINTEPDRVPESTNLVKSEVYFPPTPPPIPPPEPAVEPKSRISGTSLALILGGIVVVAILGFFIFSGSSISINPPPSQNDSEVMLTTGSTVKTMENDPSPLVPTTEVNSLDPIPPTPAEDSGSISNTKTATPISTKTPTFPPITLTPSPTPTRPVQINTSTIGYSASNNSIQMISIGSPAAKSIVVVGSFDGSQVETAELVNNVAAKFRSGSARLPDETELILVPSINPDGSRLNIRGVDINRNWDTGDWVRDAPEPWDRSGVPGAGGSSPFSEPETRALRDLLQTHLAEDAQVILVVLHASERRGGIIYPGFISTMVHQPSEALAHRWGEILGYSYDTAWDDYQTPGEAIDWAVERGIPSIDLVFLKTDPPPVKRIINALAESFN